MDLSVAEPKVYVIIYPELLEVISDGTEAIVYQWVRFRCNTRHNTQSYAHDGHVWWRAPRGVLVDELHITEWRAKRALQNLTEAGFLIAEKHTRDGWKDRAVSYRVSGKLEAEIQARADWANPSNALDGSIQCSSSLKVSNNALDCVKSSNGKKLHSSPEGSEQDLLFEDWYKIYPRKMAKAKAAEKFKQALKKLDGNHGVLFDAVRRYAKEQLGNEQRYIAYPATWLHQERWNDYRTDRPVDSFSSSAIEVLRSLIDEGDFKSLFEMTGTSGPYLTPAQQDDLEDMDPQSRIKQKEVWWRAWATENLLQLAEKAETISKQRALNK